LTCGHFRTNKNYLPHHEEQLKETEAIIETAKCNGWQRQVEMNLAVKSNLERIIIQVKGGSND
jgi:integrase/recombinase XerD